MCRGKGTSSRGSLIARSLLLMCALCLLSVAFPSSPARAGGGPAAERSTLPTGARLIVSEQRALPLVVVEVLIDAGARRDPQGKEGLAALTADLLSEATKTRSASQISEATDLIGASLGTSADTDFAVLSLTVLSKDLDTGLDLLTDVLLHPTFPEAEIARRREAALAAMKAQEDNPGNVADRAFLKALFRNSPYGHPVIGTPDGVRRVTRKDLVDFYAAHYRPEGTIITVAGDVSATDIASRLRTALQGWASGGNAPFVYPPTEFGHAETVTIDKPITQANIILGQLGIARDNPDYYAITVMNFILGGGGFTSRLLNNIRTKGGLAYSVGSMFSVNKSPGAFEIVMQTKNASADDAIQRACAEIAQIRSQPVEDDELAGAKLYLTGSFPMRFDTTAKIAAFLSQVEFYNLGRDYADTYAERVNAVTKDDVRRVAQQYLHPNELLLVAVATLDQAKIPTTAPCP